MESEWTKCALADACRSIDYGLTASASERETGPKFLRITDIVTGHIDWNAVPHVPADDATADKYRLHDGDIVLARTGASTGASAYVKDPPPAVFASYLVRLQAKPEFDARFLAYYLKSEAFWTFIRGVLGDKSAQPNASASTMTKAPLRAPKDKDEQRAIAGVLGALDDKIELNRRMNRTLEAMARALFKSWFIDFDPVRAKADGRTPPGMDAATAALFPATFQDSPLGPIPNGWHVGNLLEIASLISGGTPKTSEPSYWDGEIPWASAKDVSQCGSLFLIDTERKITSKGLENSSTRMIPKMATVVVARGATTGRMAIFGSEIAMNQTCYALHSTEETPFFLYSAFNNLVTQLVSAAHGSVFDTITTATFRASSMVLPPKAIRIAFDQAVGLWFKCILANQEESRTLSVMRDTLLPKLISGEIRVADLGEVVVK